MNRLRQFFIDDRGATAVEYGLIASLIVVAMIGSFKLVANQTTLMWNNVSNQVITATK